MPVPHLSLKTALGPAHAVFDLEALERIHRTVQFWRDVHRLAYVPLPWQVPPHCMAHTKPAWATGPDPATMEGPLVASGEQSFLWLDERGLLPAGARGYVGWSPCFRLESYDAYHHHYFMKAELFIPVLDEEADDMLIWTVRQTMRWWRQLAGDAAMAFERRDLPDGTIDIELEGLELGSFGVRPRLSEGRYVFATALAEPRWSIAMTEYNRALPERDDD